MPIDVALQKIQKTYNVTEFTAAIFLEANTYLVNALKSGKYKIKETKKEKENRKKELHKKSFAEQMAQFNITAVAKP